MSRIKDSVWERIEEGEDVTLDEKGNENGR